MKKEKFHIEYIFDKVSKRSLWNHVTSALGLSSWFADEVTIHGNNYIFRWKKDTQEAEMIICDPGKRARFRWIDEDDENAYFEFMIHNIELTGSTALEITDFTEPEDKKDSISLWDTQVEALKRTLGI